MKKCGCSSVSSVAIDRGASASKSPCRCTAPTHGVLTPFVAVLGESIGSNAGITALGRIDRWQALADTAKSPLLRDPDSAAAFGEMVDQLPRPATPPGTFSAPALRGPRGCPIPFGKGFHDVILAALFTSPSREHLHSVIDRTFAMAQLAYRAERFQRGGRRARRSPAPKDLARYSPLSDLQLPQRTSARCWRRCALELKDAARPFTRFLRALRVVTFATGIDGLAPSRACPGDTVTLSGDFAPILNRLNAGEVQVAFPVNPKGCLAIAPASTSATAINVTVPPNARSGCIGFVDLKALGALNASIIQANGLDHESKPNLGKVCSAMDGALGLTWCHHEPLRRVQRPKLLRGHGA